MSYELSAAEKITIISQHLKNLEYSRYNLEISLIEESADISPDDSELEKIKLNISRVAAKIAALEKEIEDISNEG